MSGRLLASILALLLAPSAWPYLAVPQPKPPACELKKIRRHLPRRCSAGVCEKCADKECARLHCGRPRRK